MFIRREVYGQTMKSTVKNALFLAESTVKGFGGVATLRKPQAHFLKYGLHDCIFHPHK
jgi:hypothetical protein